MISVGNDIVENSRIRELLDRYGDRFLNRVYTQDEVLYCQSHNDPVPFLAGRFACKEAVIKAMSLAPGEVLDMREIELAGTGFGKKTLVIHGKTETFFKEKGFTSSSVSISHADHYSTAVVILYKE
ncbi:phosphopantetheinyl transferase [Leptospira ryugenii]|uniref:Holo-[acyl-carrier-protein] synthase n=1 Tax=Leptospira ryugenii TaxID=1917863 RepID=A0A2P2DZE3_9LEPT|nr:holo-ACP synthase [Leptospira ryugenii]GBF49999.1 phosphopantetheinyl transferase [Leptospira ryugenii]